ncbi:MAG: formate dehydrogenase subunit gamma [Rhodospirillales bacterium]
MRTIRSLTTGGCRLLALAVLVVALSQAVAWDATAQSDVRPPEGAVGGAVPGNAQGSTSDSEMWRAVRQGVQGQVSIPDKQAGILVQSDGDALRAFRNGPMSEVGGWALLAVFVLLGIFYALRGRIRIDSGMSGRTVLRFNFLERFAHWLTAGSFIILGLTGLNILYGRYVIKPVIGADAFASVTLAGKYAHNFLGFAFGLGVLLMLVLWIKDNIPNKHDLKWIALGGGLFSKGVHPPAKKFNAGQKLIFWSVIILGGSLTTTGLALLFPFEIALFAGTFKFMNIFGFELPTTLTMMQETQLALAWHGVVALVMMVVIVAHIYIGSVGMEGAFDAMGTGEVDENWAHEHHALWLEEEQRRTQAAE